MAKTIIIITIIILAYLGLWYLSVQEGRNIPEQESQKIERSDDPAVLDTLKEDKTKASIQGGVCDYNNPNKDYIAKDLVVCAIKDFGCLEGHKIFSNECGCGCEKIKN